jgi:hypothetical protein
MDSPRSSLARDSPKTQRTASMMFDFPQPLGPTTPINWPGNSKWVGSTKDLKPESLIDFSCTAYFAGKKGVQIKGVKIYT